MIEAIKRQPINFVRVIEAEICSEDCGPRPEQCLLLNKTKDWISFQVKNPAKNQMGSLGMCDSIGTIKVSNTFDGPGSLLVTPTGFVYDGTGQKFDKASGTPGFLFFTPNPYSVGKVYRIRALVSGSTGAARMRFSDPGAVILSDWFVGDGWHEFVFYETSTLNIGIEADAAGDISIDELEVYSIADTLTIGEGWISVLSDTPNSCGYKFCHDGTAAFTDPLVSPFSFVNGKRYRINFRITNLTAGTLTINMGGFTKVYTSNGYRTEWIDLPISGTLSIVPDAEFDGCFEVLEFGEQPNKHGVQIRDLNDVFVMDLSYAAAPCKDWYSFYIEVANTGLEQGCYKICLYDYEDVYGPSADAFHGKMEFDDATGWSFVDGIGMITGQGILSVKEGGTASVNVGPVPAGCYILEIKFRSYPDTHADVGMFGFDFDGMDLYYNTVLLDQSSTVNVFQFPFVYGGSASLTVDFFSEYGAANDLEIEYIRLMKDGSCGGFTATPTFCSNCISVQESTPCTKQITADMDQAVDEFGYTLFKTAFGFYWLIFRPMMRVKAEFHIPKNPADIESFVDNNGTIYGTGAELSTVWDFAIANLSEEEQQAVSMMCRVDRFGVFKDDYLNDPASGNYYFCPSKTIQGNWPKKDKPSFSDIEFELQIKNEDVIFNRNTI